MWKVWHRLFGLHFIAIEYGWDDCVRRVRFDLTERPYVKLYGTFHWLLASDRGWEALTFDKEAWLKSLEKPKLHLVRN